MLYLVKLGKNRILSRGQYAITEAVPTRCPSTAKPLERQIRGKTPVETSEFVVLNGQLAFPCEYWFMDYVTQAWFRFPDQITHMRQIVALNNKGHLNVFEVAPMESPNLVIYSDYDVSTGCYYVNNILVAPVCPIRQQTVEPGGD